MQKALLRENPDELLSRDACVLMGLPVPSGDLKESERRRLESPSSDEVAANYNSNLYPMNEGARVVSLSAIVPAPPRPSRDKRVLDPLGQSSPVPSVVRSSLSYISNTI